MGINCSNDLKREIHSGQQNLSENDLLAVITNTIQQAGMNTSNVGVVAYQPWLLERITKSGIGIKSLDVSDRYGKSTASWIEAANWLESGEIDAALLLDENQENQSYSAVLVSSSKYSEDNCKRAFAVLTGIAEDDETHTNQSLEVLINSALKSSNLKSDLIGLVVASAPMEIAPEILSPQDLITAFPLQSNLSCALTGGNGGLISVIKAVWCLHQRTIPGTRDWTNPPDPQSWTNSAFYIPTESQPWLTSEDQPTRVTVVINSSNQADISVFVLREGQSKGIRKNASLKYEPFYLFPVIGGSPIDLVQNLEILKRELASEPDLFNLSRKTISLWQNEARPDDFIACILGHTLDELNREIEFAVKGVPTAADKGTDWRTPLGSFMTPNPLGKCGSVSFVYPGAFNSYPGVGRDLFYLFPMLYDQLAKINNNLSEMLSENLLYPRSITKLNDADFGRSRKKIGC